MKLYTLLLLLVLPVCVVGQGVEASRIRKTSFANLGAPADSNVRDCIDCAITAGTGVCASGGTGATATRRNGAWYCSTGGTAGATGNVIGPASSVDSEIALFSGTGGKTLKRATTTGLLKGTAGVIGAAGASDLPSGIDAAKIGGGGVSSTEYDFLGTVTSNIQDQLDAKQASLGYTAENSTNKDATGGYAGLTLFKINFKNAANTFTSFFTNTNTTARTYTFQDRDGTIVDNTDLALKAPLASPTFTGAPNIAAAIGTNLALGGATIGLHALAVIGTVDISSSVTSGGLVIGTAGGVFGGAGGMDIGFFGLGGTLATAQSLGWTASASTQAAKDTQICRDSAGIVAVGTSSCNSLGTLKAATINGVILKGGPPGIAGNGTLNTGSKDSAGKITATGTGASTIVLTFSSAFTNAPACIVTNETTANLVRPVSTTTTLTIAATIVTGDSLSYVCLGY